MQDRSLDKKHQEQIHAWTFSQCDQTLLISHVCFSLGLSFQQIHKGQLTAVGLLVGGPTNVHSDSLISSFYGCLVHFHESEFEWTRSRITKEQRASLLGARGCY